MACRMRQPEHQLQSFRSSPAVSGLQESAHSWMQRLLVSQVGVEVNVCYSADNNYSLFVEHPLYARLCCLLCCSIFSSTVR